MCGIASFSLSPNLTVHSRDLSRALLLAIEHRGKDSTGHAWTTEDDLFVKWHKAPVEASKFELHSEMIAPTAAIFHTRMATTGSPTNNNNNHPINTHHVIGVHNGMLWGETADARRLELPNEYEVDSEILFRVLDKWSVDTDFDKAATAMGSLTGDAAITWLDTRNQRTLYAAALSGRPLIMGMSIAPGNEAVVFASTKQAIEQAAKALGVPLEVTDCADGQLITARDGILVDVTKFTTLDTWARYDHSYGNTGYHRSASVVQPPTPPGTSRHYVKGWVFDKDDSLYHDPAYVDEAPTVTIDGVTYDLIRDEKDNEWVAVKREPVKSTQLVLHSKPNAFVTESVDANGKVTITNSVLVEKLLDEAAEDHFVRTGDVPDDFFDDTVAERVDAALNTNPQMTAADVRKMILASSEEAWVDENDRWADLEERAEEEDWTDAEFGQHLRAQFPEYEWGTEDVLANGVYS